MITFFFLFPPFLLSFIVLTPLCLLQLMLFLLSHLLYLILHLFVIIVALVLLLQGNILCEAGRRNSPICEARWWTQDSQAG